MAYAISEHLRNRLNAAGSNSLAAYSNARDEEEKKEKKNKGGLLSGVGYVGGQLLSGIFGVGEGVYDFVVGGVADLFGAEEFSERLIKDDITGDWQRGLNEWYNPSKGMQFVGDVASGLGQTVTYVGLNLIPGAGTALSTGAMVAGAGGRGVTAAYQKTGKLGNKEWLYGTGSGLVEMGLEKLTGGVGKITKSITKSAGKEVTQTVAKSAVRSGLLKNAFKTGAGEFVEEAASEFIDPYLQRATIDPNAENATLSEIARAGAVGFVSGAIGSAGGSGIGNAGSVRTGSKILNENNAKIDVRVKEGRFKVGNRVASTGNVDSVLGNAENLLSTIDSKEASDFVAGNLVNLKASYDAYNKLSNKEGIRGKMLLGEIAKNIAYTEVSQGVDASKIGILDNAEDIAQYLTNKKGEAVTVEDIKNNKENILTDLAIADFSAKMIVSPEYASEMISQGKMGVLKMQSQYEAWKNSLTQEQLAKASADLGVDLSTASYKDFNKAMGVLSQRQAIAQEEANALTEQKKQSATPLPQSVSLTEGETQVYRTQNGDFVGVKRTANGYTVAVESADGSTKQMTAKPVTEAQVNELIGKINENTAATETETQRNSLSAQETESATETTKSVAEESKVKQIQAKAKTQALTEKARALVKDFDSLPANTKARIREMLDTAQAFNVSEENLKFISYFMVRRGVSVSFAEMDGNGVYDTENGNRFIQLNGKNSAAAIRSAVIHEFAHDLRDNSEGYKILSDLALKTLAEEDKKGIKDLYEAYYQEKGKELTEDILNDELTAYALEKSLNNEDFLKKHLNENTEGFYQKAKRLASRIASWFKGKNTKGYQTYKALADLYDAMLEAPRTTIIDKIKERASLSSMSVTQKEIDAYIKNSYEGKNIKEYQEYAYVDKRLIQDIGDELDLIGFVHALRDNDIRHIRNSHGEGTNEKYPITPKDLSKIPDIVKNYDKVYKKENAKGEPGIVYVKVDKENVVYYVEATIEKTNGKKLLINKQMVKTGISQIPNLRGLIAAINKKEGTTRYLADLQEIRKAYVQDVTGEYLPTNNIAELDKDVKLFEENIDKLLENLTIDELLSSIKDTDSISDFGKSWENVSVKDLSEKTGIAPKKIEILFKRKGLGNSHIDRNKMAVMTNERLNREIKDSGATNKTYARSYITRISPTDFIDLTVASNHLNRDVFDSSVGGDSGSKMTTYDYTKGLKESRQTPYLHVDMSTGKIIGHNGRHRMRALEMAGIESAEIVVSFFDENGYMIKYNAETIPDIAVSSQFDTKTETHLSNVIPLNESHRDEIFSNYGEKADDSATRYSLTYAPTGKTQIAMDNELSKEEKAYIKKVTKRGRFQSFRVAFTNAQAGLEDELKYLGIEDYEAVVQSGRTATAKAQQMIGGDIYDITAMHEGKNAEILSIGIDKVMAPIKKANLESEFFDYLFNLHNIDRVAVEKPVNGNTIDESKKIVADYEKAHPEFKDWLKAWDKMTDAVMTLRVKAGLITQERADELKKTYKHYVPTYREGGAKQGMAGARTGKNTVAVSSTLKKATGSTDVLLRPDEVIARQMMEVARAVEINYIANKLYEGYLANGENSANIEIVSVEKMDKSETEDLVDLEAAEKFKPNKNTGTVTFYRDGKRITMKVSKNILTGFEAFHGSRGVWENNFAARALAKAMQWFKTAVTNLNPFFLIRNAVRDIQDAFIYTKNGAGFAKAYPKAWKGILSNSKEWQLYLAAGGINSSIFSDEGFTGKLSKRGFEDIDISTEEGLKKGWAALKKAGLKFEAINQIVEQIPRFTEFLASLENGKTVDQALLDSADVTVNFGRSGVVTKVLNRYLIPFFNASVQGASKIYRTFTARKNFAQWSSLVIRCSILGIVPAILNNMIFDDDEEYQKLRTDLKENYFLFKLGNKFIKIPRGRINAILSGAVVRGDMAIKGEEDAFEGYVGNIVNTLTPVESASRTIFSPFTDVKTNTTWYGTAIEGREFENKAIKDRYDEGTSSIAILLGKSKLMQNAGLSPKKIHYLIDQYTGVIGDFVLPMTTKSAERTATLSNFTVDPVTNNKLSSKFYKIYDETTYKKSAGDENAALQIRYYNKVKDSISTLYKQKDEIQKSNLSDKEKLAQTRLIQVLINKAYQNAIDESGMISEAFTLSEGLGKNYSVTEVTLKNYKKLEESKESVGRYVITYNGLTTGKLYETGEKAAQGLSDMIADYRYAEGIREVYGTERALKEYNSATYEKAQKLNSAGVSYDDYYFAYMTAKQYAGDSEDKRDYVVGSIDSMGLDKTQTLMLIYALGYSVKDGEFYGMTSKAAKTRMARYIKSLKISTEEKISLAKACGLTVKNGKIITK